jgi:hypothetical protein
MEPPITPREPGIQAACMTSMNTGFQPATKGRWKETPFFPGVIFYKQIDRSPIFGVYFEQPWKFS